MLSLPLGQASPIRAQAADGNIGLYPRVLIYDDAGAVAATLGLAHVALGLYTSSWTPATAGLYTMQSQFFSDAGHTVDAGYDRGAEEIHVTSMAADVARILGLLYENTVIDQQVYDVGGKLTGARIRSYDTKAHALAPGATGLVGEYAVVATYDVSGQLNSYTVTKE